MRRAGRLIAVAWGGIAVLGLAGCDQQGGALAASSTAAAPDPAAPDPAAPDPAAPDPGAPDAAESERASGARAYAHAESGSGSAAAVAGAGSGGPVARSCDEVVDALTDAVARYEVAALAEGAGAGDRLSAAAEMLAAVERARREAATQAAAGLPAAAGPAVATVIELHDGLGTRGVLDEDDAAGWRAARDRLESWCASRD